MEFQWNQTQCTYLRQELWQCQSSEQTQEIRLPEGMPDVGRILCAWGQVMLRGKQWRTDSVTVSGGVSGWILYEPEDGTQPQCMEAWLPFQMKWNLPGSRREGVIRVDCCLRSMDARVLSSRKILALAAVGLQLQAMEPDQAGIFRDEDLPEGVQLLRQTYPVTLAKEAGEKVFTWEEELPLPEGPAKKLLCCQVYPVVTEQTVTGSRVVFRGECSIQMIYMTEGGLLQRHLAKVPFAQYAQLEQEYEQLAQADVVMAVASMEPVLSENGVRLQCELIGQYMILDQQLLQVVADAYSPYQVVRPEMQTLQIPLILDRSSQMLSAQVPWMPENGNLVDATFFPEQPVQYREEDGLQSQVGGYFQMLYYDADGALRTNMEPWNGQWDLPAAENSQLFVRMVGMSPVQLTGNGAEAELPLEAVSLSTQPIVMVSGLHMGEKQEPDPNRPALILRRAGDTPLWDLAKSSGSTVDAIRKANRLTGDPELGQMLLIPVP